MRELLKPVPEQARRDEAELAQALETEQRAGLKLATLARTIALAGVALVFMALQPSSQLRYTLAMIALLAVSGLLHFALFRSMAARAWVGSLFVSLDAALLTFWLLVLTPALSAGVTPVMMFNYGAVLLFFLLIALSAFSYAPGQLLWAGIASAAAWAIGVLWVVRDVEALKWLVHVQSGGPAAAQSSAPALSGGWLLSAVTPRIIEATVLLLTAGLLATVIFRLRRLFSQHAVLVRKRTDLARYFAPHAVDELSREDEVLAEAQRQSAAILATDIVGWSRLLERQTPERAIALLREIHARLEKAVFKNNGTLERVLGDRLMASFGMPITGAFDAAKAVACAREMLTQIAALNDQRVAAGDVPVRLSIGLHYGDVLRGNIGGVGRLELVMLGDAVDIACRLEAMSRKLACHIVASAALIDAARQQAGDVAETLLEDFREIKPQRLRGRTDSVDLWTFTAEPISRTAKIA